LETDIPKENQSVKTEIEAAVSQCELEQKILMNEVECFSKIESKLGKDGSIEAYENLCKKFEKFKMCIHENFGKIQIFHSPYLTQRLLFDTKFCLY
jgi:hypothetical protein